MEEEKYILDMTCGGRSIWFQKNHPHTIYFDQRDVEYEQTFGRDPATAVYRSRTPWGVARAMAEQWG